MPWLSPMSFGTTAIRALAEDDRKAMEDTVTNRAKKTPAENVQTGCFRKNEVSFFMALTFRDCSLC